MQTVEELTERLEKAKGVFREQKAHITELETELAALREENENLKKSTVEVEQVGDGPDLVSELKDKIKSLDDDNVRYAAVINKLTDDYDAKAQEVKTVNDLNASLSARLDEVQKDYDARVQELNTIRDEMNAECSARIEAITEEYNDRTATLTEEHLAALNELKSKISDLQVIINEKNADIDTKDDAIAKFQSEIVNLTNLIKTSEQCGSELARLKADYQHLEESSKTAIEELSAWNDKLSEQISQYQHKVSELQSAVTTEKENFKKQVDEVMTAADRFGKTMSTGFDIFQ